MVSIMANDERQEFIREGSSLTVHALQKIEHRICPPLKETDKWIALISQDGFLAVANCTLSVLVSLREPKETNVTSNAAWKLRSIVASIDWRAASLAF